MAEDGVERGVTEFTKGELARVIIYSSASAEIRNLILRKYGQPHAKFPPDVYVNRSPGHTFTREELRALSDTALNQVWLWEGRSGELLRLRPSSGELTYSSGRLERAQEVANDNRNSRY